MTFEDQYISYFRHQAENHPDLLHQDTEGQRAFSTIDIEEAMITGLRSSMKPKQTVLKVIQYTYRIRRPGTDMQKQIEGGFMVAHYFSPRNSTPAEYLEALITAERITDEVIEKMLADSQAGHPLFNYSLDRDQDIHVVTAPMKPEGNYVAKICMFSFAQFWRNCITAPEAPAWLDGGITPHVL